MFNQSRWANKLHLNPTVLYLLLWCVFVMINTIVDKKSKTIKIETNYDFQEFEIRKFGEHFHFDFIKNKNESMGCALFFNQFNGRKYYPKEIKVENINTELKVVQLSFS